MNGTVMRKLDSRLLAPLALCLIPGAFAMAPLLPIAVLMAESLELDAYRVSWRTDTGKSYLHI